MVETILAGLVVLDPLGVRAFWRLLMVTPVTLAAVLLVVPSRYARRTVRCALLALYLLHWASFLLTHLAVFLGTAMGAFGYLAAGAMEYAVFPLWCSKYRDCRTAFFMLSVGVLSIEANAVATLLVGPGGSFAAQNGLNGLFYALLLAYFIRFQRASVWACAAEQETGWFRFCSIPALVGIVLLLFHCFPKPMSMTVHNPIGLIVVLLLQPVVYRVLFDALRAQRERGRMERDAAMLQMQVRMMEEQARVMEGHIQADAVARHDRRHFHQVILAHLDAGDTEGARAAIREQLDQDGQTAARCCEDPVLNQLLSYFAQWCEREQIRFTAQVRLPDAKVSGRTELMVALCNLLENAVHACGRVPDPAERMVRVKLMAKGEQIYLEAVNTYTGELELDPGTGLPRTDVPGHGYGLESVAALADGRLACSAEQGLFHISMLI